VTEHGFAGRARGTKLTVGVGVASFVTQPVQFVAVRRENTSVTFITQTAIDPCPLINPAVGYASYTLATSPVTCAAAIIAPVLYAVSVSLEWLSERMFVPGA
jgi:hypothetical protein